MGKLYSRPAKAIVMIIFLIGALIVGYFGSWIYVGLSCDMTIEEMYKHSSYETSNAAAYYLQREAHTFIQNTADGEKFGKSNAYIYI